MTDADKDGWLPNIKYLLELVQNLPPVGKMGVSLSLYAVATFFVWIVWQKAPESKDSIDQNKNITNNDIQGGVSRESQAGIASSHNQIGGTTAGVIINNIPPATDQQKTEALERLQSQIQDLAMFPDRVPSKAPPTMLQPLMQKKYPLALYSILEIYYKVTIDALPHSASEADRFKREYYEFQSNEMQIENEIANATGALVEVRFRDAWFLYVKYFLLRYYGNSQNDVKNQGDFLNYGITWDSAELIYTKICKQDALMEKVRGNTALLEKAILDADLILKSFSP